MATRTLHGGPLKSLEIKALESIELFTLQLVALVVNVKQDK